MNTQIYNVLPGRPFGDGSDGSATLSSDPHTRRTAIGTSGTTTLTLNSGAYSNGDLILIHQTRGASSGTEENWEVNKIVSGGGTTSLTLLNNLGRTYTSGTQVLDIKQYINLTIGSFTVTAWNGSTGGISAIAALGVVTWSGTLNFKGGNASSATGGTGGGFRGGDGRNNGQNGEVGEGYYGNYGTDLGGTDAGNGGKGGTSDAGPSGGGGNGTAGTLNESAGNGDAVGNTDLTSLFLGGGAGGAKRSSGEAVGAGGAGAGALILWTNNLTVTGSGNFNGGNGSDGQSTADGGAGAGGSVLINGSIVSLGSGLITANAGTAGGSGGAGGAGRIKVNFGAKHSGTTSPSYNYAQNTLLSVQQGGGTIALM